MTTRQCVRMQVWGSTNHVKGSGSHGVFEINRVDDNERLPPEPMSMMVKEGIIDRVNTSSSEGGGKFQLHWQ
jgi:hypothetical protein